MNQTRFAMLVRALAGSASTRRALTHGLAATVVAALAPWGAAELDARKRRRRKRRKTRQRNRRPLENAFGCRNVGVACTSANQCCSGICEGGRGKDKDGRRRKKTCRAHDSGGCRVEQDSCSGTNFTCTTVTGEAGFCHVTTGNGPYCAFDGIDSECTRDEDCIEFCGPQAACSVCAEPGQEAFRFCAGPGRCTGRLPETESTTGGHAR